MQVNVNQMSLTNAVASNRPAIAQGLTAPESLRPVIEQDAVEAASLDKP